MTLISFEEVEQLATIEKLADMPWTENQAIQIRCSCPNHGGEHKPSRSFDPVAFAAKLALTIM